MIGAGRLQEQVDCHPYGTDAVLATVLLAIALIIDFSNQAHLAGNTNVDVLALQVFAFAALIARSVRPRLVVVLTTGTALLVTFQVEGGSPVTMAVVVAVLTAAARTDRRTAVTTALIVGPVLALASAWRSGDWTEPDNLAQLAWVGFAAALGDAGRNKRAYLEAVEERARRAERTREEEAQRRVIEERMRIARELHDVVAHHIAVIHVQAGVVGHLMTDQPEKAQQALGHVRHSSRTVLDELSGLLDVLRQPDDPRTPTDPSPSLDQLGTLVDTFAASGLRVDWQLSGAPQPLSSAVDLVAYRLVQEGLTNAHKHGTGSARLQVAFQGGKVAIDIVNPSAATDGGIIDEQQVGSGHGLIGMRERARAVGGSLRAAAESDGTWRVTAQLPLQATT